MRVLSFPLGWFTPTPEARRAAAALAEGFCPFPGCGYPFDAGLHCPVCEITWTLTASGFSGEQRHPGGSSLKVCAYPFAQGRQPVIDLGPEPYG